MMRDLTELILLYEQNKYHLLSFDERIELNKALEKGIIR